jgi:hypothetical protein
MEDPAKAGELLAGAAIVLDVCEVQVLYELGLGREPLALACAAEQGLDETHYVSPVEHHHLGFLSSAKRI